MLKKIINVLKSRRWNRLRNKIIKRLSKKISEILLYKNIKNGSSMVPAKIKFFTCLNIRFTN